MSLFKFGSKSKLGIDIGTASIKLVELSKESGRFKLENYGLFELKSEDSEQSVSDQDIVWGIKEILNRGKIKNRDAVVSIPSFNTFSTVITMPFLSEEDVAKTIPYEARKYIPLPLNDVVLDWAIIGINQPNNNKQVVDDKKGSSSGSKTPTVEVFIVAVPKDQTNRYQTIIKLAGMNLVALELENTAIIRALLGNDLSPTAIINIGGRSTSILVVDGGFERASHNYEIGGFEITKSIARSLNVSLKRAEELKRSLGLKNANSDMITSAMSSLVDLIVSETKKTIHNYEDIKKVNITKVLLVGGLANMPMFVEYFTQKLNLPIFSGNPLSRVIYSSQLGPIKMELNSDFAIALGLAMREV